MNKKRKITKKNEPEIDILTEFLPLFCMFAVATGYFLTGVKQLFQENLQGALQSLAIMCIAYTLTSLIINISDVRRGKRR